MRHKRLNNHAGGREVNEKEVTQQEVSEWKRKKQWIVSKEQKGLRKKRENERKDKMNSSKWIRNIREKEMKNGIKKREFEIINKRLKKKKRNSFKTHRQGGKEK